MSSPAQIEAEVAAGLAAVARRLDAQADGIGRLRRLSGGATQELWRFDLLAPAGPVPLILRRAPGGSRPAGPGIGLAVEARLMTLASEAGVPVPPIREGLAPEDGLGEGFVMDFVEGETLGGRIVRSEAFADVRPALARGCGAILARIHAVDAAALPGLVALTPADLLAQWGDAYQASDWPRPVFEAAFRRLAQACPPPPAKPRLVHGDFRNGNLMIGPDGVRAVLDWELAHLGDPMEDLGWMCVNSWRFGRSDLPVGGFGTFDDLVAGYEAAGGAPVDRAAAWWWEAFGTLRWGVMCAGMARSFRTVDPGVERAVIARRASETEIDLLRLMAA